MAKLDTATELTYSDQKSDVAGDFPTAEIAQDYADKVASAQYHVDRLRALNHLLAQNPQAKPAGRSIDVLDFGIGDGGLLKSLGLRCNSIIGIDISGPMIDIAEQTLSASTDRFVGYAGGVERLSAVASASVDLALCINTMGYLTSDEQAQMFAEFSRITRTGGHLIVMVGNQLFDMFALNSHTTSFFKQYLTKLDIGELLTFSGEEVWQPADRRNPLSLRHELSLYKFQELAQAFAGWHSQPPPIALKKADGDFVKARSIMRDPSVDPNMLPLAEQWTNYFVCSNYCSLSVRESG